MKISHEFDVHVDETEVFELLDVVPKLKYEGENYIYEYTGGIMAFSKRESNISNGIFIFGGKAIRIKDIGGADIHTNLASDHYGLFDIQLFSTNKKCEDIIVSIPYGYKEKFSKWI